MSQLTEGGYRRFVEPRKKRSEDVGMTDESISDAELDALEALAEGAVKGPWKSYLEGRDHFAGDNFIRTGGDDTDGPDMYVQLYYGTKPVIDVATHDFVAAARQAIPRLVAEVRRLRASNR
jgi:hypothetical protein